MEDYNRQRIQLHLRNEEVQARVLDNIKRSRAEATVTIGRAAQLFGFSESKLRDLEAAQLLSPTRSKDHRGQRQYPLSELAKLAVIRELLDARFTPSDIPSDIDLLWEISLPNKKHVLPSDQEGVEEEIATLSIDQRLGREKALLFWRYYAAQALRMSLTLISEFLPGMPIGLILPLRYDPIEAGVHDPEDLPMLGESIVGWLDHSGTVHTMFTPRPSFQYATDYCIYPLTTMRNERPLAEPQDHTLIVLDRPDKRSRLLSLQSAYVRLIRRMLQPVYEEVGMMHECFGPGLHDFREVAIDFLTVHYYQDSILEGLTDIVVRMGGIREDGQRRWKFSLIALPDTSNPDQPLLERSLVSYAQSKECPYVISESTFSPQKSKTSIGIRAYQSGRILYQPRLSMRDRTRAFIDIEGDIHSNIAIPVGGEDGNPLALLYVASDYEDAFSLADRQLLRIIARFIENIIMTYKVRLRATNDLKSLMHMPDVVDTLYGEFRSESDFMRDVEMLVTDARSWGEESERYDEENTSYDNFRERATWGGSDIVSFIALDIDNQIHLAKQYGDQTMRQLNKAIGLRIQELMASLTTRASQCQLYYMYADRFYMLLRGYTRDQACEKAEQIRLSLEGSIAIQQSEAVDSTLVIPGISAHLAVTSYSRSKLSELLEEYTSTTEISSIINHTLDVILKLGVDEGGNVIMAWNSHVGSIGGYARWPHAASPTA
ncbi:MerR family transcriptional regulator [Ktedonospora formicarum]|uniref:HTH merR-type domain-containing protein n=1 Tax=Ktedonospora formicarum TaxID=2778364 RepID=A0A8J3I0E7_9CHLR|nr:MerR family transcriptional regulator [Ktedonospora formicarum]GHO43803.1 hypothetical protein KSX_19660 [Ktedonospora formicarum]